MADSADIDEVLDWVGADADKTIVRDLLDRKGATVHSAALAFLRRQRASLIQSGLKRKWGVDGDYSEEVDGTVDLKAIDDVIAQLEQRTGAGLHVLTSASIVGPDIGR